MLSRKGREQCRDLRKSLLGRIPNELDVGLIIVSPMVRTIETALLALGSLVEQGVPIQAHADWQGNYLTHCVCTFAKTWLLTLCRKLGQGMRHRLAHHRPQSQIPPGRLLPS